MPAGSSSSPASPPIEYPAASRLDTVDTIHGVAVADPYRWLEDEKSPAVTQWTEAQDSLTRRFLANLGGRERIAARLKELFYVENVGIPIHRAKRHFFPRRDAGKEKFTIYWREGRGGQERPLLDPNTWSADGSVSLGTWSPSYDGAHVAYTVKRNNSDEATLYVKNVGTGEISAVDVIEGAKYASPAWTPSSDGFYYTWLPPPGSVPASERPGYAEVRFHKLGSDPKDDRIVHERTGDPRTFIGASISRDGRWLIATIEHGWTSSDVYFLDRLRGAKDWTPLVTGRDALYDVDVDRGQFFVLTNDGAPNYRVFRIDPQRPGREQWKEIVPERADATLEAMTIVGHHLSLAYLQNVVSRLELHDEDGKLVRELPLPTLGSASALSGEVDDDVAYFSFQSFTYPTEIFETNVTTGETSSWYRLKVPVDASRYVVEQLFATSRDGTRVPFFVVRGRDEHPNADTPAILYGYGGFQVAQAPAFSSSIFPWLESSGIWAVANLRGGSEYGEQWHRHGMRREKQHTFDDYLAVAEELVRKGYTRPAKLAALGASNGGLLVGAAITQRPDLFGVALCGVPLLDMIRYPLFGSGKTWMEEYGSPEDPDDFAALLAYSPYHNVRQGTRYPATLLLSADSDDRVDPMHARKFAAELQWASTGGPVLLRIEKHSGHGGADLVRASVQKIADEYSFALARMHEDRSDAFDAGNAPSALAPAPVRPTADPTSGPQ